MHAHEQEAYIPQRMSRAELLACEAMLADGLKEFLSELAMVNGGVMVAYICNQHHANLDDIIGSSTEHRIKPGRLIYASDSRSTLIGGRRRRCPSPWSCATTG